MQRFWVWVVVCLLATGNWACDDGSDPGDGMDKGDMVGDTDPDGDPDGTDPDATDPDGTDPDGTDPDGTDPDGTDPDADTKEVKPDADGDTIADEHEAGVDTDGDGLMDNEDTDSDGDGIPDADEAGDTDPNTPPADVDRDGIPDFRDDDSDNNGIKDQDDLQTDLDGDGDADFRDTDDDGDTIPDTTEIVGEGMADCDGDGTPDAPGTVASPWDCDGDGLPDYRDLDSDNDTIDDRIEGINRDTDGDGTLDRYDLDSDNDGVPDLDEAGDADLSTPPKASDNDDAPDFRDPDSDNDSLPDGSEPICMIGGMSIPGRLFADVDGDGFSDVAEVGVGSDPCDPTDGVLDYVDFYFELPPLGPEQTDVLEFTPTVQKADVFFSVDTTGSMNGEITQLRNGMNTIISQTRARVVDSAFGNAGWDDFPVCGFGNVNRDIPFYLLQSPTTDVALANAGIGQLSTHSGRDLSESGYEALYQNATGDGVAWSQVPGCTSRAGSVPAYTGPGKGGVGFRDRSIPMVLHITDAPSHDVGPQAIPPAAAGWDSIGYHPGSIPNAHSKTDALTALQNLGARVITIQSDDWTRLGAEYAATNTYIATQLQEISSQTRADVPACAFKDDNDMWRCGANQCCTNLLETTPANQGVPANPSGMCTLHYRIPGTGVNLGSAVVDGIDAIIKYSTFDVYTVPRDDGDAATPDTACFLKRIESLRYHAPPLEPEKSCNPVPVAKDLTGVGYSNGFEGYATGTSDPMRRPGSQLDFTVVAQNEETATEPCVPSTSVAQRFTAYIDVIDQITNTVLDTQEATIVVPPEVPVFN